MYPFYFCVTNEEDGGSCVEARKHYVVVAHYDLTSFSTGWMNNPHFPEDLTHRPSVDLVEETHTFVSEFEAMKFIRQWWIDHPVTEES
jgi:hypothetical protein